MTVDTALSLDIDQMEPTGDISYKEMEKELPTQESQIQKFFSGTTVLVTGGTGFLGKLMVEKLLRSCPDIGKIYLLSRPKKNKDIATRLKEQFEDVLYDKLRKLQPNFMDKIRIIEGDMGQLQLGLNEEDIKKFTNEVEVIFHGAATVRFNEYLKPAVEINVRGTRELFLLAKQCKNLRALVHISTAYSNCPQKDIDEQFYESPMPGDKLIDLVETLDEKTLNGITQGLLDEFPNVYAYTKAVAENIVQKYAKGLPVALVRPSIVISTAKEPVSGWIDNVYGPTGMVMGAAVGIVHSMRFSLHAVVDIVPGDMVVCACVAAAVRSARDYTANREDAPADHQTPIYNYVSSQQSPITWKNFMEKTELYGLQMPPVQAVWYYTFLPTTSDLIYWLICLFMHWIPAYIIDAVLFLLGKRPMLRKAYAKIDKFSEVISYFALREWNFTNTNTQKLFNELCDTDKQMFNFNIGHLNWDDYFKTYVKGVRLYLLKDPVDTIPSAIIKQNRLKYAHYTSLTIFASLLLFMFWWLLRLLF